MDAFTQAFAAGGWLAWALVGAASVAVVASVCAVAFRRARRVTLAAAVVSAMGTVGIGAVAADPSDPQWLARSAVEAVRSGDLGGGCSALAQSLGADWTLESKTDGARAAVEACVDHAIAAALSQSDSADKERALLIVAASDAPLTPSIPQFRRIERQVAAIPDGEEGRLRIRSYEVAGPLPITAMRAFTTDQLIRLRGCHARSWQQGRGVEGLVTLKLAVDRRGRIERAAAEGAPARFGACVQASFSGGELGAQPAPSRVTIEMVAEPY